MWKASDASLAVYEPSDLSIAIKADQSQVTELI